MSETITVVGNIGSDVTGSTTAKGDAITSFRLASTERWLDRQTGAWVDGATNWYSVVCFRNLARNAGCSLSKGQPVIVSGRLKVRPWERDGKSGTNVQIEADSIGHNLRLGTTHFRGGNAGATGNGDNAPAGVDTTTGEIADSGPDDDAEAFVGTATSTPVDDRDDATVATDVFEEAAQKEAVPF
ncbi:single-stranded DNA-binding protein [Tersicoccus solisilvae]|uniref:Single-stranded DNA-binding protein n=1 Tax=Tersicoccus solisilvae TaxID=1882339 RepID=A0ABQ1NUX2_9MICC|nr:single-stranded DNA-binding protein [Tersicoccus solisilvae]GGC85344.1 single-stranded DNA-binding protein [Tersicoccus solisilvae]